MADHSSFEVCIDSQIGKLSKASQIVISRYLEELIKDQNSQQEMEVAWASGNPSYGPNKSDLRTFYQLLLDRIAAFSR